jgi:thiamine kinase-like enzyme
MTAEALLTGLPIWRKPPELTPVETGRTNQNFIIRDGDEYYFGRVGVDLPHHGISRSNERLCSELAARADIAPEVCFASEGILITRFIAGETLKPATMHDREILIQTAQLLRRLHAQPAQSTSLVKRCGIDMALTYLRDIPDSNLPISRPRLVERLGAPASGGDRLVHCDIIPENLIRSPSQLFLIDWEYGGIGNREVDLASVIANADLDEEEAFLFLAAYGPHDMLELQRQRFALVVREALWCLTQIRHGGSTGDLLTYTEACTARLLKEFS